jgi:hypothetical protein
MILGLSLFYTYGPLPQIQVSSSAPSTPSKTSKAMQRIRDRLHLSSLPSSPRARSSVSSNLVSPFTRRRGGKVTEKHFTPKTRCLAILGKKMNRCATATNQLFPVDKHAYNMDILQDLANEYKGEGDMRKVFAHVLASVDTQQELVQFVCPFHFISFINLFTLSNRWATPVVVSSLTAWLRLGIGYPVALVFLGK